MDTTQTSGSILELRVALTVENFDQEVQLYRDGFGLAVVREWATPQGRGIILAAGPNTTIELLDTAQAALVDEVEVGRRVSGPVRLAIEVADPSQTATILSKLGAKVLAEPALTPWNDLNARLQTPDGMQLTLFHSPK
jgi:catechol 2,3-dioxygenase-like lactoylglutathione lyase family enzyme